MAEIKLHVEFDIIYIATFLQLELEVKVSGCLSCAFVQGINVVLQIHVSSVSAINKRLASNLKQTLLLTDPIVERTRFFAIWTCPKSNVGEAD